MKNQTYTYYQQALQHAEQQMAELEAQGVTALSRYDIEIAHGGGAHAALRTAKMLVANHIRNFKEKLANMRSSVIQPSLFDGRKEVNI